jgi:NAD(P)-dependent dehydrogenase (short-subunit alcohol dehydrogenase family)
VNVTLLRTFADTEWLAGAAGGLGRSIAEEFLAQGANIVVCDINKELIADFNEKVAKSHSDRSLVLECEYMATCSIIRIIEISDTSLVGKICTEFLVGNITDDAAIDKLFAEAEKKFGALDILVNSAGMMGKQIDG